MHRALTQRREIEEQVGSGGRNGLVTDDAGPRSACTNEQQRKCGCLGHESAEQSCRSLVHGVGVLDHKRSRGRKVCTKQLDYELLETPAPESNIQLVGFARRFHWYIDDVCEQREERHHVGHVSAHHVTKLRRRHVIRFVFAQSENLAQDSTEREVRGGALVLVADDSESLEPPSSGGRRDGGGLTDSGRSEYPHQGSRAALRNGCTFEDRLQLRVPADER